MLMAKGSVERSTSSWFRLRMGRPPTEAVAADAEDGIAADDTIPAGGKTKPEEDGGKGKAATAAAAACASTSLDVTAVTASIRAFISADCLLLELIL